LRRKSVSASAREFAAIAPNGVSGIGQHDAFRSAYIPSSSASLTLRAALSVVNDSSGGRSVSIMIFIRGLSVAFYC